MPSSQNPRQLFVRIKDPRIFYQADLSITHLDPHGPSWSDGVNPNFRADDLMDLLEPIAQYLPDYVEFTTSTHDLGSLIIGDDQKVFLEEKIAKGEYATEEELRPFEDGNRHRDRGVPGLAVSPSRRPRLITERLPGGQSSLVGIAAYT